MLIRVFLGILLSCVFCAGLAHAQTAEEIADHIQHSYETMRSFDATFVQKQTRAMINSVNTSGGVIRYRNPSLVRWETLEPEEAREIIVVGPEYVWDYVLETKNAAKMHVSELFSSKTLLRFISGQANLRKEFRVENAWEGFENLQKRWDDTSLLLLRLVPFEPEANMVLAYIGVEAESYILRRVMTVDYQGNANELELTSIQVNASLPMALFSFDPPKGTTITDTTQEKHR